MLLQNQFHVLLVRNNFLPPSRVVSNTGGVEGGPSPAFVAALICIV